MHPRLDHLLQSLLQDAVASDPEPDRCLCHPVGPSQVQADAPPDQGRKRLVRPAPPRQPSPLRSLAAMSWQRPNIGSRVNRQVHARFWERPEAKVLRATRHSEKNSRRAYLVRIAPISGIPKCCHAGLARPKIWTLSDWNIHTRLT